MWKIAFLVFLYFGAVTAGRLPREDNDYSRETDCLPSPECDDSESCKLCVCQNGEVLVDRKCLAEATESHNVCKKQEQCGDISRSVCEGGKCVGRQGVGNVCNTSLECKEGLTCEDGACSCKADSVPSGNECLKKGIKLGDICEVDVQCEGVNVGCINGTCRALESEVDSCTDGFVVSEDGKGCLKEAEKLGDECEWNKQCESVNGTCGNGVCVRKTLNAAVVAAEERHTTIGSECTKSEDCKTIDDAICKESVCQCKEAYIPSQNESQCLPLAKKAGDDCQMDKQCQNLSNSSCLNGKCVVVAAAGIQSGKNSSQSSFMTSSLAFITPLLAIGSRAVFG